MKMIGASEVLAPFRWRRGDYKGKETQLEGKKWGEKSRKS